MISSLSSLSSTKPKSNRRPALSTILDFCHLPMAKWIWKGNPKHHDHKWQKHFLLSPGASLGKWISYFPHLLRLPPPTSQSRWAANTEVETLRNAFRLELTRVHQGFFFFFLATLDHLCASFLGECRIKQSLLRGSFHLLNHGLFFPLDITCYFRVHFQKVLNGLAQNWLCIKGKNQCPRVSISTSANRPLTCPEVLGGCQWQ